MVTTRGCSPSLEENKRVIIYFFGDWTKAHRLVKGRNPPSLNMLLLYTSQQTCEAPYRQSPRERRLGSNSSTMARRLCNIRTENAHLWLHAGAEQGSAVKNPLRKLLPQNGGTEGKTGISVLFAHETPKHSEYSRRGSLVRIW